MITRIGLQDFKSHINAAMQPADGVNLIFGPNGSGKSSIKDAIEFALTGVCEGTDAGGRGSQVLITNGRATANVRVTIGGLDITRSISADGKVALEIEGKSGDKTTLQKLIYKRLDVTEGAIHGLINSTRILTMPPAEQKALLMSATDVRIPDSDLSPEAIQVITQDENDPAEGAPAEERRFSPEEIERGYKAAFARRTDVNRKLKKIQVPPPIEGEAPKATAAVIQTRIIDLEEQLRAMTTVTQDSSGTKEYLIETRAKARDKLGLEDTVLKKAQAVLEKNYKDGSPQAMVKYVAAAKAGVTKAAEKYKKAAADHDAASASVLHLEEIAEGTKGGELECPIWQVTCPVPKEEQTTMRRKVMADLKKAKDKVEKTSKTREAALKALAMAEENLEQARFASDEFDEITAEIRTLTKNIGELNAQIQGIDEQLKALPPDPEPPDPAAIATLETRIEKGRAVHKHAIEWEARERTRQELQDELEALQTESESLTEIVTELGPKGAIAEAIAKGGAGDLIKQTNHHLARAGIQIQIQADPWKLQISGGAMPVEVMSTSEKLRIGAAFQAALATTLGQNWVFIDNGDMLDAAGRAWLMGFLTNAGIQALVAFTAEIGYQPPSSLTGHAYKITRAPAEPSEIVKVEL